MPANNPVDSSLRAADRRRHPAPGGDGGRLLADAISADALFCAAAGVSLLVGAVIGPWFGIDRWIMAALGAGVAGFADVLLVLLTRPRRLLIGARWVIAADAAWVLGAGMLLDVWPSALSAAGRAWLTGATVVVAVLALAQLSGLRRARGNEVTASSPVTLRVQRVIPAPPERVWEAVADAGNYARFAAGIADTPVYYRVLIHRFAQTWNVAPAPNGMLVTLTFDGLIKLGLLGRVAALLLGNRRRLQAILAAYEHEIIGDRDGADRR
jgi:hypothetical protein